MAINISLIHALDFVLRKCQLKLENYVKLEVHSVERIYF